MLKFDSLDSTNNYAMQLIDADKAVHGLTILAGRQSAGKGQRGKIWSDEPGESLLMSIIVRPGFDLQAQPLFLAAIAVTVADSISQLLPGEDIRIKWPNDILIADKKAGGILIENIVRGQTWPWAVIGIGLNVGQTAFPASLPHATSLQLVAGRQFDIETLAGRLRHNILEGLDVGRKDWLGDYNSRLYRFGKEQAFKTEENTWKGTICGVNPSGQLMVRLPDGEMQAYTHGEVEWVWG
jgi:BirA family biotin operon repressor/biotin-[acetyl-CoA-carboxylase] ligase